MILPIFTHCILLGLGWSDTRKSLIKNIEQRSLKIIGNNYLKLPSAENLIKRKSSQFVFDCLQNNVCTPFKTYFERLLHSKNTRNNSLSVKLPKVRLEFGKKSFHYHGAKLFNELPIEFISITSRFLFNNCKCLSEHFYQFSTRLLPICTFVTFLLYFHHSLVYSTPLITVFNTLMRHPVKNIRYIFVRFACIFEKDFFIKAIVVLPCLHSLFLTLGGLGEFSKVISKPETVCINVWNSPNPPLVYIRLRVNTEKSPLLLNWIDLYKRK